MKLQLLAARTPALGNLILKGKGFYFVFLRPPLLPEDTRIMGATIAQIQTTLPGLEPWLVRVFGVARRLHVRIRTSHHLCRGNDI